MSSRPKRPGSALPNAVDSSEESLASPDSPASPHYPDPHDREPLVAQPRHLPPIVRPSDGGEVAAVGAGTGEAMLTERAHPSPDIDDEGPPGDAHPEKRKTLSNIKSKYPTFAPNQFGLTPEDLGRICNFDDRNSPSQLLMLNSEYGGVDGVGHLLKTDLENGLSLAGDTGAVEADVAKNKRHSKAHRKVAPDADIQTTGEPTVPKKDMTAAEKEIRTEIFGQNLIPPPRSDTILEIVWETIKDDPIIKVLIVGAIVVLSLGTAICPKDGWIEGLAILVAVVIVLSVTAGNDWSKDRKFKKLLLLQSDKRTKVIRGGMKDQISSWDVLVGDLVEVVVGDEIPADGLYVRGNRLVVDESPLTGESVPVKKSPAAPYMFSGCQVSEGSGVMLVTGVGPRSSGGQIQELLNEAQSEETVLQVKLKQVAVLIGKIGVASGILTFLGLLIRWAIAWAQHQPPAGRHACLSTGDSETLARIQAIAEDFVIGITVVVVAVPEGLPLAVTISLAFSMFKMIKDNCFVRHLDASETMGEATCICTDKTGTLTENRMTVVKALVGDQVHYGEGSGEEQFQPFSATTFDPKLRNLLAEGICINSNCFVKYNERSNQPIFVGSATEGALLVFADKLGVQYDAVRKEVTKVENGTWSFSSDRKRMSTLVHPIAEAVPVATPGGLVAARKTKFRLYTKGASEIVLSLCTHILDAKGTTVAPISATDISRIQRTIKRWASQGLRTLALAYRDTDQSLTTFEGQGKKDDPEHDLIFVGLVGIKDPLRKEVPGAVATCQRAGLTIRMVTGDNILTACKIARECNIMFGDGIALEGPVFRAMTEEEKIAVIPRLQVLARSSPADKHTLVNLLKRLGEVVAVTGDGTNDAPALKEADVGFAMGISGTQIAMNASDIVLLDDNFVSLVQSIRWGRNVLNCVRKFLQFQLGVNLVAIILTFVGSLTVGTSPLSTVQLLWVNLIMDSLGALALASDEPEDDILDHPPHARTESLLSRPMREYIGMQVVYQITVLLCLFLGGADDWVPMDPSFHSTADTEGNPSRRAVTMVFLTFILMQISNIVMARQLNGEINYFKHFFRNRLFILIITVIVGVQVLVIIFGGDFVNTCPLDWKEWIVCIVLALLNFPFVFVIRCALNLHRNWTHNHILSPKCHWGPPAQKAIGPHTAIQVDRSSIVSNPDLEEPPSNRLTTTRTSRGSSLTSGVASPVHQSQTSLHDASARQPYRRMHRAGQRWRTVRSAVVLMGALEEVRREDFRREGPDQRFMDNWIRFRKDVDALPTKGAALSRSAQSLSGGGRSS
ncbi:calcium-translocating P-type ATPase, PMCA-type [Spizellomyces punctatus DAOM BR117]|uniref:Calcium-transporting ATPase 2 n=1 Tax=Spizellomyces punctatus (strain DAOM BR117) TaxID=645134 RepID=A0A0L0HTL6_SPIPD|nr:calcium-translocating P-type ATPase, PMCA-type [Spizellomyces punctatus DAOM BR117]KND04245.1 calcium-translocating P-type ATPase, PMCA-type [Spizellomyces punctatus DAOM BR117]|eukprot:XP_016612284.1 calcium-translocating P-type ATPase, PMCA-type [Spizellomyces punctatus DAOM BR117]